jgi:hypothetical protein
MAPLMDDPAIEIPGLERLARDVLRSVLELISGSDWLSALSRATRDGVARAADIARRQRPDEVLVDDWAAAGLSEIRQVLQSNWDAVGQRLQPVWRSRAEAEVDLDRLLQHRGRALHEVGVINFSAQRDEMAAVVTRLRIGFEEVRRSLLPDETNWLPYLERIESPIAGLCWSRGATSPDRPTLRQGDLVQLKLVGVNPSGPQEDLEYDIEITGVVGGGTAYRKIGANEFQFNAPRSKEVIVSCYVRDVNDPSMYDGQSVIAKVIPQRL